MTTVLRTSAPALVNTQEYMLKCWLFCFFIIVHLWSLLVPFCIGLQGARTSAIPVSVNVSAHAVIRVDSCFGENVKRAVQKGWSLTQRCGNVQVKHCKALLHNVRVSQKHLRRPLVAGSSQKARFPLLLMAHWPTKTKSNYLINSSKRWLAETFSSAAKLGLWLPETSNKIFWI